MARLMQWYDTPSLEFYQPFAKVESKKLVNLKLPPMPVLKPQDNLILPVPVSPLVPLSAAALCIVFFYVRMVLGLYNAQSCFYTHVQAGNLLLYACTGRELGGHPGFACRSCRAATSRPE